MKALLSGNGHETSSSVRSLLARPVAKRQSLPVPPSQGTRSARLTATAATPRRPEAATGRTTPHGWAGASFLPALHDTISAHCTALTPVTEGVRHGPPAQRRRGMPIRPDWLRRGAVPGLAGCPAANQPAPAASSARCRRSIRRRPQHGTGAASAPARRPAATPEQALSPRRKRPADGPAAATRPLAKVPPSSRGIELPDNRRRLPPMAPANPDSTGRQLRRQNGCLLERSITLMP